MPRLLALPFMKNPFALCYLLLFPFCGTNAQNESTPPTAPNISMRNLFLENRLLPIYLSEVESDMHISPSQQEAISRYNESNARYTLGIHWIQACKRDKAGIFSILNEDQQRRYAELLYQYQGALSSFLIPSVGAKLKLTTDQSEQLEALYRMYKAGLSNLSAYEMKLLATKYAQGKFTNSLNKAADVMAESMLTPDQHLLWRAMQGKPIEPRPQRW